MIAALAEVGGFGMEEFGWKLQEDRVFVYGRLRIDEI